MTRRTATKTGSIRFVVLQGVRGGRRPPLISAPVASGLRAFHPREHPTTAEERSRSGVCYPLCHRFAFR
jgi:hypothetical protein